jgi:hypothetical protein
MLGRSSWLDCLGHSRDDREGSFCFGSIGQQEPKGQFPRAFDRYSLERQHYARYSIASEFQRHMVFKENLIIGLDLNQALQVPVFRLIAFDYGNECDAWYRDWEAGHCEAVVYIENADAICGSVHRRRLGTKRK